MGVTLPAGEKKLPATPWGYLPPQMRLLFITGEQRTGGWLADAFASDSASDVHLDEALGVAAGLARLRDELFDAVLVSHEPGELDAWEALDAIRAGISEDQAVVVLGDQDEDELTTFCLESGGDAYVCARTATIRTLIWLVARAVERHTLIAENRRLRQSHHQRLRREHVEAHRQLEQQRVMVTGRFTARGAVASAGSSEDGSSSPDEAVQTDLPTPLINHYRELLRAYVIMGSGNLAAEMERLAELLAGAVVTPQEVMLLHLQVLEEMISGLGSRSARHVMNRADMLILEVMISLTGQYRGQYLKQVCPPRQLTLPGFGAA